MVNGTAQLDNNLFMMKAISLLNLPGNWEWNIAEDTIACADASFEFKSSPIPQEKLLVQHEMHFHYPPEEKKKITEALQQLETCQEVKIEFQLQNPEGELKSFYAKMLLVKNEQQQPIYLQCSCHDVTEIRETEKRLKHLKESFDHAERISEMGNWMYDFKSGKLTCSDNLYRLVGFDPGAFEPTIENFLQLLPGEQQQEIKNKMGSALSKIESEVEITLGQQKEERYLVSRIKEIASPAGREMIVGTLHDITAEKKLQQQLEERTMLAEMLIENSIDMISAFDPALHFIAWNKKCEERYQFKKEDVIGKHILEVFPHFAGKDIMEQLDKAKNGSLVHYNNRKYRNSDGYYESYIIPIPYSSSSMFGVLMITHDITEIKKSSIRLNELNHILQQKNEEFERSNQELASFSYVASHDLQEPLRKIQTFSHRLLEKELDNLGATGKEYLKRMASAAERMQGLIEDLLTFSRTNTAPRVVQKTDLSLLVNQIVSDLKDSIEETGAVIEFNHLPEVAVINFQFKQLIENLLLNAIKYRNPSVPLHISIQCEKRAGKNMTEVPADPEKFYHTITVTDNGIGFQQQYAEKIFELFQRLHGKTEYPGTGLGLAICKKIMQNHHGFITAKGEPGKGATFTIYLPEDMANEI